MADIIVDPVVVAGDERMDEVHARVPEIAANAPLAVQATKRMMRMAQAESFKANVRHVFLHLLLLFRSQDFKEGGRRSWKGAIGNFPESRAVA